MRFLILFIILIPSVSFSLGISLNIAINSDFGKTQRTPDQAQASRVITQLVQEENLSLAYTNMGSGDYWYRLYDNLKIYGVDTGNKKLLGGWTLAQEYKCQNNAQGCPPVWWDGRWSHDEVLEDDIINHSVYSLGWQVSDDENKSYMGCMAKKPLRYGDIDGDGLPELVVLIANPYHIDWVIFSTQKHKPIFATMMDYFDVANPSDVPRNKISFPNGATVGPQYYSQLDMDRGKYYAPLDGMYGFAKLYFNDFDEDGAFDILVWRKLFHSRDESDSVKGFKKSSDTFVHYKLVDGEYQKQATSEETIKGWLAAKQLTWQKGYPSKSECPGQEGQLIPEMHDPLLNDPDVLQ